MFYLSDNGQIYSDKDFGHSLTNLYIINDSIWRVYDENERYKLHTIIKKSEKEKDLFYSRNEIIFEKDLDELKEKMSHNCNNCLHCAYKEPNTTYSFNVNDKTYSFDCNFQLLLGMIEIFEKLPKEKQKTFIENYEGRLNDPYVSFNKLFKFFDVKTETYFPESQLRCPHCGKVLSFNKGGVFCLKNDFKIFRNCLSKTLGLDAISDDQLSDLVKGKKTRDKVDFVSRKTGRPYKAYLTLDVNNNVWISFN